MIAKVYLALLGDWNYQVVALELQLTFSEKAAVLAQGDRAPE
jgi:hypothetical protein